MMSSIAPVLAVVGFVFVLGAITWIRVRNLVEITQWAAQDMDGPVRRIAVPCVIAGVVLVGVLCWMGVEPPGAAVVGLLCAFGSWMALLGVLGVEGVLGEPGSVAAMRQAQGLPPPSSTRGRILAIGLGVVPIIASAWLLA